MKNYVCNICKKDFKQKSHYTRHLSRKKPCIFKEEEKIEEVKEEIIDVSIKYPDSIQEVSEKYPEENQKEILSEEYDNEVNLRDRYHDDIQKILSQYKEEFKRASRFDLEKYSDKNCESKEFMDENNNYFCEYCEKTFTLKNNLYRHLKYRCRKRIEFEKNVEIEELKNKFDEFAKSFEEKHQKETRCNTINIHNNNIQLNPFGKENIDYLKEDFIKNAIKIPHYGLPNLIRLIHFNKDHPENMNIKQRNKKKPMVDVFNGKEWITMDKADTIHNMVASKKEIMDNYFDKFIEFDDSVKNNYEKFSYSVDAYLQSQMPNSNCFSNKNITAKCKELFKSFICKIDVLLMNRELQNNNN